MFNPSILELQSQINYYQEQQELAEQELDRLKMTEAFAEDAAAKVEEALEHIDPKYLDVFKEHLLALFPTEAPSYSRRLEAPVYLEESSEKEDDIEYMDDSNPDYKSIEQIQEEDPDTVVAVFHSKEHLKSKGITPLTKEVKPEKSYYELTGRRDLRPTTYEDLAPNISYSSDGRAYIGFNDKQEAEEFRESISSPSIIGNAEIMNGYKYEVKFYCDREYVEELQKELENDWTPEQKAELDWQEQLVRIAPDVFYDPSSRKCYIGFSAKGRADHYGSYLTRILDIAEKYTVSAKPSVTTNTKYELVLEEIDKMSAQHLSKFNLKKEYDDSKNREARELWRTTRQRKHEPACKPLPKLVPLNKVKLGDIVYLNSITNQYKVLDRVELDGIPHLEVICVYNSERPSLVSAISYLKECYLVPADEIQIDPTLVKASSLRLKDEAPLAKTVELKPTAKKFDELTTEDFAAPPYSKISLDEIEVADIVSTGEYVKAYYEITAHNGSHLLGRCIHHDSLKMRIGQENFYIVSPYLVERADSQYIDSAA